MNKSEGMLKVNRVHNKRFSLKTGLQFFMRTNTILLFMTLLFIVNKGTWRSVAVEKVSVFIFTFECVIILFSILACINPNQGLKQHRKRERICKNEWIGMFIAIVITSLLSLFMLPANLPFPSTVIFLILSTNLLVAFYSIAFHHVAIGIYELNVFKEKESVTDYTFKYIAILFSNLNYYVQIVLKGFPLIINKLFAIIFVIVLSMLLIVTGTVFTY